MNNPRKPHIRTVYFRTGRQDDEKITVAAAEPAEKKEVPYAEPAEEVPAELRFRVLKSTETEAASRFVRGAFVMFVAPLLKPAGRAEFYKYITPAQFKKRLSDNYTYVAVVGDEIVGLINAAGYSRITLLFVALHMQRKGIGAQLLSFVERRARKKGCAQMTVHAAPNSVGAYENMGFSCKSDEITENGIRYFMMEKELSGDGDDCDSGER